MSNFCHLQSRSTCVYPYEPSSRSSTYKTSTSKLASKLAWGYGMSSLRVHLHGILSTRELPCPKIKTSSLRTVINFCHIVRFHRTDKLVVYEMLAQSLYILDAHNHIP